MRTTIRWRLIEVAVLSGLISCERTETPNAALEPNFNAGVEVGVGAGGGMEAGGASWDSDGLVVPPPVSYLGGDTSFDDCHEIPLELLEPPCSGADIVVEGGCNDSGGIGFEYSLDEILFPTPELRLYLLPPGASEGLGGQGGESSSGLSPMSLYVWLARSSSGTVDETRRAFTVTEAGGEVNVGMSLDNSGLPQYFYRIGGAASRWWGLGTYLVAHVVLQDGDRVLSKRRVIFEPFYECRKE